MLGIKTFEIKGLFNRFDVKLPLDNDVNIFFGENGLGKTTILNCFCYALECDFEKLSDISFQKIILTFNDNQNLELNYNELGNYIEMEQEEFNEYIFSHPEFKSIIQELSPHRNDVEIINYYSRKLSRLIDDISPVYAKILIHKYINNDHDDKTENENIKNIKNFKKVIRQKIDKTILHFPTYRRIEEDMNNLGIDMTRTMDYEDRNELIQFGMSDVENKIKNLLDIIKSESISTFRKMTGLLIHQYLDESNLNRFSRDKSFKIDANKLKIALARIGDEIKPKDKEKIENLVENKSIYHDDNVYLLNLIKNLINSYDKQRAYDERIKDFVNVCNKYLRDKEFVYDESTVELRIIMNDGNEIEMENLSSGEKQIVSTFSKLYIQDINDCVVIFDEPELSLSIIWQRMFLPDIMASKKCKFILAVTHSPFIFDNEFDYSAYDINNYLGDLNDEK